jgi:hypothetical protein
MPSTTWQPLINTARAAVTGMPIVVRVMLDLPVVGFCGWELLHEAGRGRQDALQTAITMSADPRAD